MTETRQWVIEHGTQFAVPPEIDALVRAGELCDESWHNDISPRFVNHYTHRELWVHHPDSLVRELPMQRFVACSTESVLYEGDDVRLAIWSVMDDKREFDVKAMETRVVALEAEIVRLRRQVDAMRVPCRWVSAVK
jgi:hypothetical protein